MNMWTLDASQMETLADQIKANTVAGLQEAGLISDEDGIKWCEDHTFIMRKVSKFRAVIDKIIKREEDDETNGWILVKRVME